MHELGITQQIVEIVADRAEGRRVGRVRIEVGKLSAVLPDAVRFCWDLCIEDTLLQGSVLEILETPGRARCRGCAAELLLDRPFGRCACGSSDLDWLTGEELHIREVEFL